MSSINDVYQSSERYDHYKRLFKSERFNENLKSITDLTVITQAKACDIVAKVFCDFHQLSLKDLRKLVLENNVNTNKKLMKLCVDNHITMRNISDSIACYKRLRAHLKRDRLSRLEKRHV
jgi:hypothetical protein